MLKLCCYVKCLFKRCDMIEKLLFFFLVNVSKTKSQANNARFKTAAAHQLCQHDAFEERKIQVCLFYVCLLNSTLNSNLSFEWTRMVKTGVSIWD